MSFYKIIGLTVLGLVMLLIFRRTKEEYALFVSLFLGVGFTVCALDILRPVVDYLRSFGDIDGQRMLFTVMFKTCGVALITSFAGELCRDASENALAMKVELCGKCTILSLAFPLFKDVLEQIFQILG